MENQIGGNAIKPGDIIRSAMGPSVEVNNTDAEGRLILADALYHAAKQKPQLIVDCATLTGACGIALGDECAGFYSNNDKLGEMFYGAGETTAEPVWRMPLLRSYAKKLDTKIADISNIVINGSTGGGSLTAALFLEKFALYHETEECQHSWVHLDMAGWSGAKELPSHGHNTKAIGVRMMIHFLHRYLEATSPCTTEGYR